MVEEPPQSGRLSCGECQRRKQGCNRQWPCNRCTKRNVPHLCTFGAGGLSNTVQTGDDSRKRQHGSEDTEELLSIPLDDNDGTDIGALGYNTDHFLNLLTTDEERSNRSSPKQYYQDVSSSPTLAQACQVLPPRPYTDTIVQNFIQNVNFHYHMVYPEQFMVEYQQWWNDRVARKPLGVHFTCLLLMVCACSLQYTDEKLQQHIEVDLAQPVQKLSQLYHDTGRTLQATIPVKCHHLITVQTLLHSSYWYKGEVRFLESWHILAAAVIEAQELGINQESAAGALPELEREMRRRIWCVLDTWDWQCAILLSRNVYIDREFCDVGLPSLTLEKEEPSPSLQMKLQSEIIKRIAHRFRLPRLITELSDIEEYQKMVGSWIERFPRWYRYNNPDRSKDADHPWMKLHRQYLQTTSQLMLLDPIRPYLSRGMSATSPIREIKIRDDGVGYALKLITALHSLFELVYPRDSKSHFVCFSVFDTAALLCSALLHDVDKSAAGRDEAIGAIEGALSMLYKLKTLTSAIDNSYRILIRLMKKVRDASGDHSSGFKKAKLIEAQTTNRPIAHSPIDSNQNASSATSTFGSNSTGDGDIYKISPPDGIPGNFTIDPGLDSRMGTLQQADVLVPQSTALNNPIEEDAFDDLSWIGTDNEELGNFTPLWNYRSLDLNYEAVSGSENYNN